MGALIPVSIKQITELATSAPMDYDLRVSDEVKDLTRNLIEETTQDWLVRGGDYLVSIKVNDYSPLNKELVSKIADETGVGYLEAQDSVNLVVKGAIEGAIYQLTDKRPADVKGTC